jgi:hypothetical protein
MCPRRKTMHRWLNEEPFEYETRFVSFSGDRKDCQGNVKVEAYEDTTEAQLLEAVSEFIWWHMTYVLENLNGFAGYDCIRYDIHRNRKW